jgi:hypothetical protein
MARKYTDLQARRRREDEEEREHARLRKELQEDLLRTRALQDNIESEREELRQLLLRK